VEGAQRSPEVPPSPNSRHSRTEHLRAASSALHQVASTKRQQNGSRPFASGRSAPYAIALSASLSLPLGELPASELGFSKVKAYLPNTAEHTRRVSCAGWGAALSGFTTQGEVSMELAADD
jgi:hypothetical protein